MLYPEFLSELLDVCGERGIHRAVDTSGLVKKEATAVFVAALPGGKRPVNLLPYHAVGRGKDDNLGQIRDLDAMHEPSVADLGRIVEIFAAHGLEATVGG